ncbi:MAG: AbrB/MazE/SpoVT family DNA-binding domain-containing protein [Chloroflexi bacterium]|nr:AbrB/MazE/SpoVT family DNA-binding domain-containing protein [Ktedonobacteraceae bacterium]MBV8821167.1 AbrB/MazE/SpoVT family DNA-binding domain-containing protein [Ktedonobacteraceae bacterium]MBV9020002.1 AbrB/MazE/SpoVT family DNA-binding domain-containing protein [Ktedonobacteraceae bacterium]MBV9706398.1 AbrB/MazE/SpoVT family DNA-binding domain-containing protein [Chloroflexota bacterium]
MIEIKTTLTERGKIVIPPEYRQALGLDIGDEVVLRLENGEVRLFPSQQRIRHAQELLRRYIPEGRSLSDELIAERRMEKQNE